MAINKAARYIGIASAVTIPGIWWWRSSRIRDDVPRLDGPPAEGEHGEKTLVIEAGPSADDVTRMISQEAYSFLVGNVAGVSRYDGTRVASNTPCEDRFVHGRFTSPWSGSNDWMAWAVLDGHAGWQTASLLETQLVPFVRHSLGEVKPIPGEQSVPEDVVRRAITKGFVKLDNSIINVAKDVSQSDEPLQDKIKKLVPAYAGSCALLSVYDPATSALHVACTGDSRAVLGQQRSDGTWEVMPLSVDQTGHNNDEVARLNKEHPDEPNIVKDGRVLGMAVSRAFGDCRWKWPLEVQQALRRKFYGPASLAPKYDIRTPPYLTAEPVVTTTRIDPSRPSFLIMATDGLWDMLSNPQAVRLVGQWLGAQPPTEKRNSKPKPTHEPFDFGKFWEGVSWKFVEARTTVQDENAAVHLVRNALGGNHNELIAGRLAFDSPFSRHLRDDMTVQVVFFNIPGMKA